MYNILLIAIIIKFILNLIKANIAMLIQSYYNTVFNWIKLVNLTYFSFLVYITDHCVKYSKSQYIKTLNTIIYSYLTTESKLI